MARLTTSFGLGLYVKSLCSALAGLLCRVMAEADSANAYLIPLALPKLPRPQPIKLTIARSCCRCSGCCSCCLCCCSVHINKCHISVAVMKAMRERDVRYLNKRSSGVPNWKLPCPITIGNVVNVFGAHGPILVNIFVHKIAKAEDLSLRGIIDGFKMKCTDYRRTFQNLKFLDQPTHKHCF